MNSIHQNIIKKLDNLTYETLTNILFYGPNGSGKYTLFKHLLSKIFKTDISVNKHTLNFKNKSATIYSSKYHFEIYLDKKKYDKSTLLELMEFITETKSVNGVCKIIYFKNAQFLPPEIISFIKNSIERQGEYVKYILTMNNICNLKYKSIFTLIRVPLPPIENILNIIGDTEDNKQLVIKQQRNLTRIYFLKEHGLQEFPSNKIKDKIFAIIEKGDIKKAEALRELVYELCSKNYDKMQFVKYIFSKVKNKDKEYIDKVIEISRKINISYKDTIHIEYFCFVTLTHYNKLQHL